jgi:hypothetical protein
LEEEKGNQGKQEENPSTEKMDNMASVQAKKPQRHCKMYLQ